MTNRGVCPNLDCENARNKKVVEVYPGPGEYCPECGDLLEALTPLEALATFDAHPWSSPPEPRRKRGPGRASIVISAIALAIGLLAVAEIANVVHLYAAQAPTPPQRTVSQAGGRTRTAARPPRTPSAPAATSSPTATPTPRPTQQPTLPPHPTPRPKMLSALVASRSAATQRPAAPISSQHDVDPRLAAQLANASVDGFQTLTPVPTPAARTPTAPSPTATTASCIRPDAPATMVRAALAETPSMAQQLAISGTVQVLVSLDAQSRVVRARVQRSPNSLLNVAALTAARSSQFRTQITNCEAIAADYVLDVTFQ
jgi:TonB family protein